MVSINTLYKKVREAGRVVFSDEFNINMLGNTEDVRLRFVRLTLDEVRYVVQLAMKKYKEIKSVTRRQSTAELVSKLLNYPIQANREVYTMGTRDVLIVVQLKENLQEEQVLDRKVLMRRYKEGKIEFWAVWRI